VKVEQVIPWALLALILGGIAVVIKLFQILNEAQRTVQEYRPRLETIVTRLEAVAASTQKLMDEELGPTLHAARETLVHVQKTTQALAETVQTAKHVVQKANTVMDVGRLATAGGAVAKFVMRQAGGAASGLMTGISAGFRAVAGRKQATPKRSEASEPPEDGTERRVLPETPKSDLPVVKSVPAKKRK
jgi:uncharacterized protein YoxC